MNPNEIAWVEIYPPIGIARLGNSPTEWYLGPEVPGRADVPQNGFKDSQQKIKRQAARFRVYAYDKTGKVLGELNQAEGFSLKWSVNVANTKASYYLFEGRLEGGFKHPKGLRNPNVQGDLPPEKRDRLNINPGVKTVQGAKAAPVSMTGQFWGSKDKPTDVYLGEIFTDERGRLMVLGGHGWSRSIGEEEYPPLMTDFDNEDWVDDTSDGWVDVVVEKNGRSWRPQYKSWVISSTPKYATGIYAPTTLFDLIENIMEERKRREQKERYDVGQVEYYSHVEPLLRRATLLSWVNIQANGGHGANGNGHFTSPEWQKHLSDPSPLGEQARKQVLGRLRMPETQDDRYKAERAGQAFPYFMPWLSGDGGRTTSGDPTTFTSLTQLQYERMVKWADGNFVVGNKPAPPPFNLEEIPLAQQPRALTEAHLEWCIGLPLFPGIEVSWPAEKEETYNPKTSFRIREDSRPGDMTKYLSLPWQSDFYMCRNYWWPSVRPDSILPQSELKKLEQGVSLKDLQRVPWERGLHVNYTDVFGDQPFFANTDMTKNWHQLGFIHPIEVTPKKGKPQIVYVEKERGTIHASERSRERAKKEFLAVSGSLPKVTGKKGTLHSYNMPKRTPITTLESLKSHLQMAIQVELSTIPLYLFAMYSIDSPNQNDPRYVDPHVKAIRTVVSEEMLHLTLAGNVLLAIGGTPRLYDPEIVPIYPRAMQGHYPYLEMHLADLKANLATFIQIEYPKRPDSLPQAENYESLAQFYEAIEEGIKFLNKTGKGIFQNPRKEFQFAPGLGFNPTVVDGGGSIVVTDEATALKALEEIVIQGEGSDWGKQALGKEENHFTVFMNLVKDIGTDLKCYPVITDPITHEYKDPRIFQVSRTFDAAYCYLLLLIENLWQISELNQRRKLVFADLFGVMIGILAPLARMMVTLPIDENLRAAPAFNFYDFGPNPTLAGAYQAVKTEMQAAIDAYLAVTEETSDQVTVHNYGPQIESLLTVQATLNRLQSDSASKL